MPLLPLLHHLTRRVHIRICKADKQFTIKTEFGTHVHERGIEFTPPFQIVVYPVVRFVVKHRVQARRPEVHVNQACIFSTLRQASRNICCDRRLSSPTPIGVYCYYFSHVIASLYIYIYIYFFFIVGIFKFLC